MIFDRIFVEKRVVDHPQTTLILRRLKRSDVTLIDRVDLVFNVVKKPYLQKRDTLNLFIGRKDGERVKAAPDAYGLNDGDHYYFIHAYNCIYECEYCYLQGYFHSPDIVLFINHDEIADDMRRIAADANGRRVWFHAGEFSDSLALNRITRELDIYWAVFAEYPNAWLELRAKSVNIQHLRSLEPLPNTVISFSLAPDEHVRMYEHGTPSASARIKAMATLANGGFRIGIHLDPIIDRPNMDDAYTSLIEAVSDQVPSSAVEYISIGTVRFTEDVFREVKRNYSESDWTQQEFNPGFDGKIRYQHRHRLGILKRVRAVLESAGYAPESIYECMESTG